MRDTAINQQEIGGALANDQMRGVNLDAFGGVRLAWYCATSFVHGNRVTGRRQRDFPKA